MYYNWNAAADTFNTAYGETSVNAGYDNVFSVTFNGHRRGICPVGWHLPSDAEWTALTDYLSSQGEYTCGGVSYYIAKALASTTGWNISTNNCAVGNDQSVNNASGFGAVPAGLWYPSSEFANVGYNASFWSSTQAFSSSGYLRRLYFYDAYVIRSWDSTFCGCSVRCLRD